MAFPHQIRRDPGSYGITAEKAHGDGIAAVFRTAEDPVKGGIEETGKG